MKRIMEFFLVLIDKINEVKMLAITAVSVFTGSALGYTNLDATPDPMWFCEAKPVLQTIAWIVAIIAGVATTVKVIASFRKKKED